MPYLNLNLGVLIYEDLNQAQPLIRPTDITRSFQQVAVQFDKSDRITLQPGDTTTIVSTTRSTAWDNTTQLEFQRYLAANDNVRVRWTGTGTNPAFRTARAIAGAADTVVSITRVSPNTVRITNTAGTAWDTSTVQVNDLIRFEKSTDAIASPFSLTNQGQTWLVQAKTSSTIDFLDNGLASLDTAITLGSNYAYVLRCITQGPVRIGDTIDLAGAGLNPSNQGRYQIVDVSSDFVEVVNPFSVDETVLYGTNVINIYDHEIGFVNLRASGRFQIRFGGQTSWVDVTPLGPGNEAVMAGSFNTYQIMATNPTQQPVTISVQHAAVT